MKHTYKKESRAERKSGGRTMDMKNKPNDPVGKFDDDAGPSDVYAGEDSNVVKEARKRKRGGSCMKKGGLAVEGKKSHERMDRPKRASGGKIGAEKSPFTEAKRTSNRPGADIQSEGGQD